MTATAKLYDVKCDDCKTTIRTTTKVRESYAGGRCAACGLAACHPDFRKDMAAIGAANGKSAEEVYVLWRKYSTDCRNYDQSAILAEFLKWYAKELPQVPNGYHRLG